MNFYDIYKNNDRIGALFADSVASEVMTNGSVRYVFLGHRDLTAILYDVRILLNGQEMLPEVLTSAAISNTIEVGQR